MGEIIHRQIPLIALFAFLMFYSTPLGSAFEWNHSGPTTWSMDCSFKGNDFRNQSSNPDGCGWLCYGDANCTHFAWTEFQGGTCWLKSKSVDSPKELKKEAMSNKGATCGFLDIFWTYAESIPGVHWAYNCDFPGGDIKKQSSPSEKCGELCQENPSCNHFVWKNIKGEEICSMKSVRPLPTSELAKYAPKAVCGIFDRGLKEPPINSGSVSIHSTPIFYGVYKYFENLIFGSEWLGIKTCS